MSIIADIISGGTSGILGSLLGVVGGFLTSKQNLKQQELKNAHEIALIKAENESMQIEYNLNLKRTELEITGEIANTEADAYIEAVRQMGKPSLPSRTLEHLLSGSKFQRAVGTLISVLLGLIDVLKASVRPMLTIYLVIVTTVLTFSLQKTISLVQAFSGDELVLIYREIIFSIIFLTMMVVGWWFQNRQQSKFSNNLNDGNRPVEN